MAFFNTEQKLSDGIGRSITRAIYKAIDYKETESVQPLVDFIRKTLFNTFKSKHDVYSQFISIPSYYYFKGYTSGNFVNIGIDAAKCLTDLVRYACIISLEKAESLNEVKKVNQTVALTFTGYSQLLYQIINNRDFKTFEKVIDCYRLAYPHAKMNIPKYLQTKNLNKFEIEEKYQEDIQEYRKLSDFHRRIKFACLSWLWFLYDKSQISHEELLKFTNLITFKHLDTKDLLKDLIFYNTYSQEKFDWNRWDYVERKELQVYSPPQPEDWLTFGFALYSLKNFNLYGFKYEQIENTELTKWLPEKLDKWFKKILDEKEKWVAINWPEKERRPADKDLSINIEKILTPFKNLKRRYEKSIDSVILHQDLSVEKINTFKEGIYKAFYKNSAVKEAFDIFKNIEFSESISNQEKDIIGINTNFTKGKMMFVEENHQHIYGTDDFGATIAREIDNRFIEKVINLKSIKQQSNLNTAIEESLKEISQKGFTPNLIIIGSNLSYNDKGLMSNKDFTPSWEQKGERESVFDVGFLKDIPILSIFSNDFDNKVLVCDFNSFIKATEWNTDNNYNQVLDIQVKTLEDDEAQNIYDRNPKEWKVNADGIELDKKEALELIKLSMQIMIFYEILFEILEIEAFEIYHIDDN
jgi:hypothetical protein